MPSFERYVEDSSDEERLFPPEWTKLPFPQSWEKFERGVDQWLGVAWGPDWKCPQCGHRFWMVLEPILLGAATSWPGRERPNSGAYPAVPVACAWCMQITPVLLFTIFEPPPVQPAQTPSV